MMHWRSPGIGLLVACVAGGVLWIEAPCAFAAGRENGGKIRVYYVAADEVNWDYAPSGRDEAMGMDFDPVGKGYTQSGPHQIGRIKLDIEAAYQTAPLTGLA